MIGMIIMNNEQYYRPINSDEPGGLSETPLHFIFRYKGDSVGR